MGLALGGPAPDFTLRDQFGQDVTLSSYRGRKAVALIFYPAAFSGRLHRRDVRDPRPARGVPHLRHRGAGDLLRPGLLAAGLRRPGRPELPVAQRLLAARRGGPRLRRLRRAEGVRPAVVVRRRQGGKPAPGRCTTPRRTAGTSTSTCGSCTRSSRPARAKLSEFRAN